MVSEHAIDVRPYQVMCLVCRAGGNPHPAATAAQLRHLARAIRRHPVVPLTLRCNVASHYRFQNPGDADDGPGGALFNAKRDLDIVQRLGLVPGDTRPAWELLKRLMDSIPTAMGICGYDRETDTAWRGCPHTTAGFYERGIARGIGALIPPRTEEDKAHDKARTAPEVLNARHLYLRPHHLMCMACFHGGRQYLEPVADENVYEVVAAIQRNPAIPVTLVRGCCMICTPCAAYDPSTGLCIRNNAMGLRDEKKDLDVLQRLGLQYNETLPARDLYRRLFRTIASTVEICGCGDGVVRGWEWTICGGAEGCHDYVQARAVGMHIPGLE